MILEKMLELCNVKKIVRGSIHGFVRECIRTNVSDSTWIKVREGVDGQIYHFVDGDNDWYLLKKSIYDFIKNN